MQDVIQALRYMQLEKTIGELKALQKSYFDTNSNEKYTEISNMISKMIDELRDYCG
jgi:hypothetical protein